MGFLSEYRGIHKIVGINEDRAIIEFICDLPIPPQSEAIVSELEIVHREQDAIRDQQGK